jgi:hypothetical protein
MRLVHRCTDPNAMTQQDHRAMGQPGHRTYGPAREDIGPSAQTIVQGKPAVRRGRKARDLGRETARSPIQEQTNPKKGRLS